MLNIVADGGQFHPGYVLLDPYSTKSTKVLLSETYYNTAPYLPPYLKMDKPIWMGLLASLTEEPFDWQGAHHPVREHGMCSPEGAVIMDLDITAFTQVCEQSKECIMYGA